MTNEPEYLSVDEAFKYEPWRRPLILGKSDPMKYHFQSGKFGDGGIASNGLLPKTGDKVVQERLWKVYNAYDKLMGDGILAWASRLLIGVKKESTSSKR